MAGDPSMGLMVVVTVLVQVVVFIWVVVLAAVNWRAFARNWKVGLVLALLLGACMLPVRLFDVAYFDPADAAPPQYELISPEPPAPDDGAKHPLDPFGKGPAAGRDDKRGRLQPESQTLHLPDDWMDSERVPPAPPELRQSTLHTGTTAVEEQMMRVIYLVIATFSLLFAMAWLFLSYVTARGEWGRIRSDAMPLLARDGRVPWATVSLGAAIGAGYAVLTAGVFAWLNVSEGAWVQQMQANYPGAQEAPLVVLAPVMMLFVSIAAIVEEIEYRGVLLGFLFRVFGSHGFVAFGSMLFVSVLFGLLHLLNTDAPLIKFTQILILGLMTAELVRRSCLEAAIACHLGLNVVSVAIVPLIPAA